MIIYSYDSPPPLHESKPIQGTQRTLYNVILWRKLKIIVALENKERKRKK